MPLIRYCYFIVVQDVVHQLQRLVTGLARYHNECHEIMKQTRIFPIEVDLSNSAFVYESSTSYQEPEEENDDDELLHAAEEAKEQHNLIGDL